MLIRSFADRRNRRAQKHEQVLNFLLEERCSSFAILQSVLELSPSATLKTLNGMERLNLIRRHRVPELRLSLWGITTNGIHWSNAVQSGDIPWLAIAPFEPSKLKFSTVRHLLALQEARLAAARAGWKAWVPGYRLVIKHPVRPDARTVDILGRKVAVEVECTIKTHKRYAALVSTYLQAIKAGEYDCVQYVCPDPNLAPRLVRLFASIQAVPVLNERVALTDRHWSRFQVFPLQTWPLSGGMDISSGKA